MFLAHKPYSIYRQLKAKNLEMQILDLSVKWSNAEFGENYKDTT